MHNYYAHISDKVTEAKIKESIYQASRATKW